MSKDTKEQADHIKRYFQTVKEGTKQAEQQSVKFDKDLSKKIQKVQEASQEVVKHIEEKN
jgi:hypothetical protein